MERILIITGILVLVVSLTASARVGGGDIVMKTSLGVVTFSHDSHAGKSFTCQKCHPEPYLTVEKHKPLSMEEMGKGGSCGLCHDGKQAFSVKGNCDSCHKK